VCRELIIGRDTDCQFRIMGAQVSRRHAEIGRAGPVWFVHDLNSKNGVYLNGARVEQAVVNAGDVLRVGEWVGVFIAARGSYRDFGELGHGLLGGETLAQVSERAKSAARSDLAIVLQGETGTGKEKFARAIHAWSGRPGPFLAVNCAGYTESLATGELFGYRKGAFTGADRTSPGHIRGAEGGTLFLDEIVDLPPDVQAKLLRVLEQREVLPLGETRCVPVDVRFIAASQVPLAQAVEESRFRADLRARLEGVVLCLPPLRDRKEDIGPLFLELLAEHASEFPPVVDARLVERLCCYSWPLNVRELDLLVRRLLVLHRSEPRLGPAHLLEAMPDLAAARPDSVRPGPANATAPSSRLLRRRDSGAYTEGEVNAVLDALNRHGGNVTRAAAELRITRQKAYRLLEYARGGKLG
jgi:transcriptional regulator with PAS, ATPase and Fis domain